MKIRGGTRGDIITRKAVRLDSCHPDWVLAGIYADDVSPESKFKLTSNSYRTKTRHSFYRRVAGFCYGKDWKCFSCRLKPNGLQCSY